MATTEEKKETTLEQEHHERITYLEGQLSYMKGELAGMDAQEAKRKEKQKLLAAFLVGFCYALLLKAILD